MIKLKRVLSFVVAQSDANNRATHIVSYLFHKAKTRLAD